MPLVNIVEPNVNANPLDRNFNDPSRENATFYLAPGERARLRCAPIVRFGSGTARAPDGVAERHIALGVVAQGANCVSARRRLPFGDSVAGPTECRIDEGRRRTSTIRSHRRSRC